MNEEAKSPDLVSHVSGTLCEFCDSIFRGPKIRRNINRPDYARVESLVDRCVICAIIFHTASKAGLPPIQTWPYLEYGWTQSSAEENTLLLGFWVHKDGRKELLGSSMTFFPLNGKPHSAQAFSDLTEPVEASTLFNMAYVGSNKQLNDDWALIETWMQSCLQNHQACNQPKTPTNWRPTRLLDLDPPELPKGICLREGDEIPPCTRYTTLSHCWGSAQLITLTTENKASMKKALSLSAFPKTFRDAIAITTRLQVRYLWIDSLCIIQSSREDWAKESGLICSVYGNSHCNIAATAASNSSEGCFTANPRQTKDARRPFAVHIDWDGWRGAYCASQSGPDIWDELDGAPLSTRAWVHQERLLAPRVVHFGLSQLAWECNEVRVAELSPPGTSVPARGIREFSKQGCASMWIRSEARGPLGPREFLQRWGYVWSKYAGLRLTRETDRLVALAGIVDKIQPVLKDDFLAGLWRRDLEQQLCWWTPVP
ncbi:hypothetical protein SLS56_001175 [Neofusicoccum ribis]|uniref:Heterokaryon incompatibility domain-containing protein n=1 Tax=Neofusicoccum ribis TaxID=45134 RepID=A0ABR3TAJ7_9PEZI